ncbi:hypothetical protein [Acaryochloris sp. 'Moss Beach']|uniref:hypothetical protein n=1 Tax=Acaryochloris sp. 'Moss Beach' TaxID=2740837 RepID=UPI001F2E6106|nr:hypothetical protein [Acaryochloris sp. 'Moss Beach']
MQLVGGLAVNKQLWNLLQRGRGVLQLQPLGCLSDRSNSFCLGCEPGQYYECEICGYLQPYCKGADDDYFELCDDCWGIAEQMHVATGIAMGVDL